MADTSYDKWFEDIYDKSKLGTKTYDTNFTYSKMQKLYEETIKNGGTKLTRAKVRELLGSGYYDDYKRFFEDTSKYYSGDNLKQAELFYNGPVNVPSPDGSTTSVPSVDSPTYSTYSFEKLMSQLGYTPQDIQLQQMELGALNEAGLTTDYQALLDAQNAVVNQQYAAEMNELARAENDMYRAVGLSQRQMERDIAKRRQQALKSGMSTAQLAAQEQQNILTAQLGATQIAQDYANKRYGVINQFAGANAQNYVDVLAQQQKYAQGIQEFNNNLMNQQAQFNAQQKVNWAQALSNVYPQNYASDSYKEQLKQ